MRARPLDRADRDSQLVCNIGLLAVFKVIHDHNAPLKTRQIRDLALQALDRLCVPFRVVLRVGIGQNFGKFIDRNTDHARRAVAIIIAQRIVGNRPDKFARVANVVLGKQRAKGSEHDLLRKILRVLRALATLERKAEDGL